MEKKGKEKKEEGLLELEDKRLLSISS